MAQPAAEREVSGHPAEGPVSVAYGENIPPIGGKLIYFRRVGSFWYMDWALGEGPIDAVSLIKFGDLFLAEVQVAYEVHLGVPGDTTVTMFSSFEPTYTVPEGIAHVAMRGSTSPSQIVPSFNPFGPTFTIKGRVIYNPETGLTELNSIPIAAAWDALTNTTYGGKQSAGRMHGGEWSAEQNYAAADIGGGVIRWPFGLLIDTQASLKEWLDVILRYSNSHLRYYGGAFGVYSERERALSVDDDSAPITYDDLGLPTSNTSNEIDFVKAGLDEIPTVVTVDYSDLESSGGTASVQVPDPSVFDPGADWIEIRLSLLGVTTAECATRHATLEYNLRNLCDVDITVPAFYDAIKSIPGDRIRVGSRKLIGALETPPNTGAVEGWEDAVVADVKMGDSPVLRCGLYRDAVYGPPALVPAPPNPPVDPPDPDADPDCPTDLIALHADPSEYGMIEFAPPADDSIISYYAVYDIFFGPEVLVGTVNPPADPLGGDGKYHKSFPTLVHIDADDGDAHVNVRVKSVSYAGNFCSPGPTDSWDETGTPVSAEAAIESASYTFVKTAVSSTAYDWETYTKITSVTKKHSTTIQDPTNDFFLIPAGNAQGVICPKMDGHFYVSAQDWWEANADDTYRGLVLAYLAFGNGIDGLHQVHLAITSAGTGYTAGDPLVISGSTPASGGFVLAGTVLVGGTGNVIGFVIATPGIGYSAAPTVTVGGSGSGAVITASLPAAFTFEDLNFDCETPSIFTKGSIWFEDLKSNVNDAAVTTTNHAAGLMSMKMGSGLLVGVQQGSGTGLDLFVDTSDQGAPHPRTGRVSIFRVPPAAALADQYTLCADPG